MTKTSIIGPSSVIVGDVSGQGVLEIAGRVQGDVNLDGSVQVNEGGVVFGSIHARSVRVRGRVEGSITAQGSLLLEGGAHVIGDIATDRLGIEEGAQLRGSVSTERAAPDPPRGAKSTVQQAAPVVHQEHSKVHLERRKDGDRKERERSGQHSTSLRSPAEMSAPRAHRPDAVPSASGRAAAQTSARPRPPAPVVPAMVKGVRGRRRPAPPHE